MMISHIVAAAAYDAKSRELEIEYFNGLVYVLRDVPENIAISALDGDRFDDVYKSSISGLYDYEFVKKVTPLSIA